MNNQYNRKGFQVVKVKLSNKSKSYTYAAHVKQNIQLGELVIVPVKSRDPRKSPQDNMDFGIVTGITGDLDKHLPTDFQINHVIQRVSFDNYYKIEGLNK